MIFLSFSTAMAHSLIVCTVDAHQLAALVRNRNDNALILDGRSFLEYNASHIVNAINVGCAKLMKRRLQQEKLSIEDFLAQNCHWNVHRNVNIIVYDQNTCDPKCLPPDSFMGVFLQKLLPVYKNVSFLKGGFLEFQAAYPHLCQDERAKLGPLTSLSQPCLPITNHGPTRILSFVYLGSQNDALNKEILKHYNITYQLNVSNNCPKPDFIQESNFMRIPVIDNYSEKLLPHFSKAFQFLDKVRESGGCVLIHCLAGISRSATVAIAYVMKTLKMSSDEAYRYVKAKRATVSPNFNFLGQLLEFEKQLQLESVLVLKSESSATSLINSSSPSFKPCYQKNTCDFFENDLQHSSQRQISTTFCVRYADEAETISRKVSETKGPYSSLKKGVNVSSGTYNYIPCQQSSTTLNIKCIPVSSLKELNFTSCQTSSYKSSKSMKNIAKDYVKIQNCATPPSMTISPEPLSPRRNENKRNSYFMELHLPDKTERSIASPDFISPGELKSFEFDPKSYTRSDSVSTSGLGSDGSDFTDSWTDFTSSCERESDVMMDEDYSSVPSSDRVFRRSKSSSDRCGLEDSYDDSVSLYPKYELYNFQHGVRNEHAQTVPFATKLPSSKYEELRKYPELNDRNLHHIPDSPDSGKTQMLYRAQSCPGMLSSELSSYQNATSERNELSGNVKLRKSKAKSTQDKCRNRYSCSSIDYMEYSVSTHESCPDTLHLESGSKNSISSSHCNYRHSMIQVS
ncbi:uncharacterized protein [Parasteatoda tepidariorum]|nr:uncharacterized protein LOC107450937 [Parasteatoda tepidariorum]XP_015922373.1 uncharacterized protein LOC107450937 [Parasteatoda tepidariorum]XP_015922375.1 uncharacterized protein LOC107450937 [Parasteatoda tepidariorum]